MEKYLLLICTCSLLLISCATPYTYENDEPTQNRQEITLEKIRDLEQQILRNYLKKNIFNDMTSPDFLNRFSVSQCENSKLILNQISNTFMLKNDRQISCANKWATSFVEKLNETYNFEKIEVDYVVPYIAETTQLSTYNFENLEKTTKQKYMKSLKRYFDILEYRSAQQERENEERRIIAEERQRQRQEAAYEEASEHFKKAFTSTTEPLKTPRQIDYTCQNNCNATGYSYQFCQEKCSYGGD